MSGLQCISWWQTAAEKSNRYVVSRSAIGETLAYHMKREKNGDRIIWCFSSVYALSGWGVDSWHRSSTESRHRQDVSVCVCVCLCERAEPESSPLLSAVFSGCSGHFEGEQQGGDLPGSDRQKQTDRQTEACTLTHSSLEYFIHLCVCVTEERKKANLGLGYSPAHLQSSCPALYSYNILSWTDIFINLVCCVNSHGMI